MPLGRLSIIRLGTCAEPLQRLVRRLAIDVDDGLVPGVSDMTVLCGWRNQVDQDDAYRRKASKLKWPHSMHNRQPSQAVDVAPYPLDWDGWELDPAPQLALRTRALELSALMAVPLRIIEWDRPHLELAHP